MFVCNKENKLYLKCTKILCKTDLKCLLYCLQTVMLRHENILGFIAADSKGKLCWAEPRLNHTKPTYLRHYQFSNLTEIYQIKFSDILTLGPNSLFTLLNVC